MSAARHGSAGSTVVVTGAAGQLGRRVLPLLAADPSVARVIALDTDPVVATGKIEPRIVDLLVADLDAVLDGADVLVHLASSSRTEVDADDAHKVNVDGTALLLAAASRAGVDQVVGLSSAMVYGAWANNPIPLTEDAPVRPNPEFAFATQKARVEQLLADWAAQDRERVAAVLRPAIALSEGEASYVARLLAAAAGVRAGDNEPPQQFVALDDVASAVDIARRERLDGPFNVAPDGWVPAETVQALTGAPPRVRLPARVAARLASWSWELQLGPIPPGLLPYTMFPWVIANDRLKAAGWQPSSTNEEAYVAGTEGSWWSMMSPKRKQELALGASGVAMLISGGAVAYLVRRTSRARRN